MPAIRKGLDRSGGDINTYDIRSYIITSVDSHRKAAMDAAKGLVAAYCARDASEPRRYQVAGITDEERIEIRDRMRKYYGEGDTAKAEACVPDSWVDRLTVSGNAGGCLRKI